MNEQPELQLAFSEFNTTASSSVVLIHGATDSSTSWNGVRPYLSEYHLLIPDLPAHGRSRKAHPVFSPVQAADMIASIIRVKGKNGGHARVVGLSLGAHVALQLITRHPDLIEGDAVLTGYNIWSELNITAMASIGWSAYCIGSLFPESKESKNARKDENGVITSFKEWSFWKNAASVICTEAWPQPWSARTLIIAAGRKGDAPLADRAVSARKLQDIGVHGNRETVAYWNDQITHPWPILEPELFAKTTLAWFNKQSLPDGFVKL